MSKRTEYAAHADECQRMAAVAGGPVRLALLAREAEWRRMARGCFDTDFGGAHAADAAAGSLHRLVRSPR